MINMMLSTAAAATHSRFQGKDVRFSGCSTDSRQIERGNLFIALKGPHFDGHDYVTMAEEKGASSLMLARKVKHTLPSIQVADTCEAIGLLSRAWRQEMSLPIIAITGSNGKTTVKEMISCILSDPFEVHATPGNLNNTIGVPLTLFGLDRKHQYAVIEMGANRPGEIKWLSGIVRPDVAIITQCAPAHLEGFESIQGVAMAKGDIYSGLQMSGTAIINADDDYADFWKEICRHRRQRTFGINTSNSDVRAENIFLAPDIAGVQFQLHCEKGCITVDLPLPGQHNVMNALAAAACCLSLDIDLPTIKNGLEKMSPVKGRLQIKKGQRGVRIMDDTYNANPTSLEAGLEVLRTCSGRRYLVLGDMDELGAETRQLHFRAGEQARRSGIDGLFTLGQLASESGHAFGKGALSFETLAALRRALQDIIGDDTTILIKGSRSMQMEQLVDGLVERQD